MSSIEDLEEYVEAKQITFAEAMQRYDVVSAHHDPAHGSFVVMADRADLSIAEFGYASPSPWTAWTRAERVPELRERTGLRTYYDMKRADGTVRGALRLLKTPVMAARWFVEPATDSKKDKKIADFIEKNFFDELNVPWSRVVEDALLMCEYGYMPLEKVFTQDAGKIKLAKLAPRHPLDVMEWYWDVNGGPDKIRMFPGEPNNYQEFIEIPIEKLVVFVLEEEAGDIRGISILRSAYKHYYYKDAFYKIDAIQKERHGVGVPIIKLNPGYTDDDRKAAEDLGRNLRTNEKGHIVAPSNWEVMFAELKGQPVDCLASIQHHDMKIKSNILAPFMDESNIRPDSLDIFFKAARYIAGTICDTFNHHVIRQLVDYNWAVDAYPKLRVRRIGEWEDIRTMSFAYRNFVGAGTIVPDDELEEFVRGLLDLPPMDKETARTLPNPHIATGLGSQEKFIGEPGSPNAPTPPKVGLPRQAPAPPVGLPRSNAGRDVSGGK